MTSSLERLREERFNFRDSERKAAEYILANSREVINLPITQLAEQIGVSEATIIRMCKKAGFSGFQELKITLAMENVPPLQAVHQEIQDGDDLETVLRKVFTANRMTLESTLNVLSVGELKRAIEAIDAAERVYVFGVGGSGPVAHDAAHKIMKTGKAVVAYSDTHVQATAASLMGPKDVVIAISHSGSTRDVIDALQLARENGATTIGIANYARAPMDGYWTSSCPLHPTTLYRTESSASRIAQLSIIDALQIGLSLLDLDASIEKLRRTREAIVPKRF